MAKKSTSSRKTSSRSPSTSSAASRTTQKRRAKRRKKADYAKVKRALDKYRDELRRLGSRVTGVSIGPRLKNGKATKEMVIRLQVSTKRDKQWLKKNAEQIGYRRDYDGVDTDIVVWQFKTSAKSKPLPGGTCINGPGGNGTLGTTVIIDDAEGIPTGVWLTAAHVASQSIAVPTGKIEVSRCDGSLIGNVTRSNYLRDQHVDVAFILPEPRLPAPRPTARSIAHLAPEDLEATVTMDGAKTPDAKGKIISIDFDGEVTSPGGVEHVTDHFLVRTEGGVFAVHGDSGGIVMKGRQLLGIMRAASKDGVAVVTKLDVVRSKKDFSL